MAVVVTPVQRFTLQDGETLLEGLQRTGHVVEYQCKEGYCGSCRLRVSGECIYLRQPLACPMQGEVFACCALAKSDLVIETNISASPVSSPQNNAI